MHLRSVERTVLKLLAFFILRIMTDTQFRLTQDIEKGRKFHHHTVFIDTAIFMVCQLELFAYFSTFKSYSSVMNWLMIRQYELNMF